MRTWIAVALGAAGLGMGAGCIPSMEDRRPLAVERGARDLGCAEDEVTAEYLGERLFGISGCGRHATYRVICKLTVHTCYLLGGPDDGGASRVAPPASAPSDGT